MLDSLANTDWHLIVDELGSPLNVLNPSPMRSSIESILAVGRERNEMRIERANKLPVGKVFEPVKALKEQHLVDLASHRRLANPQATKIANGFAKLSDADWLHVGAERMQGGVSVVLDGQAVDRVALPSK